MGKDSFGHIDALPDDIRDVFMWLCQETVTLGMKWQCYLDLFDSADSRNFCCDIAGGAIRMIEESLRIDMTMTICRLADPLRSAGKTNLSFAKLADHYSADATFQVAVKRFTDAAAPVVQSRNKLIGHNDLNTKLQRESNPLPALNRHDVEQIIQSACNALNHAAETYGDTSLGFDREVLGGGKSLLKWLRIGYETWKKDRVG